MRALSTNPVSLLIYTSLPLLTPPTLSSVVSYSAHVLILLLHPHILRTLAKLWLHSSSPNTHSCSWFWTHTHPIVTFEARHHESLSKYHSAIDWMAWWNQLNCPQRAQPLGNFPDRPKSKHSVAESHLHHCLHCAHYAQWRHLMNSLVSKWESWLLKDAAPAWFKNAHHKTELGPNIGLYGG